MLHNPMPRLYQTRYQYGKQTFDLHIGVPFVSVQLDWYGKVFIQAWKYPANTTDSVLRAASVSCLSVMRKD